MNPHSVSRRRFLSQCTTFAAASSVTPHAVGLAEPAATRMGSELAIATICVDGFSNRRHEPAFRLLPQVGIPNVELNLWYPDTILPNYAEDLRRRCATAGLKPVCVQGSGFGGEGRRGVLKDVGHKLALMYAARDLGCRLVKCTGAARDTDGGLKAVIEVCRELTPAAEALGQYVLLENHARNVLETIADYEEIFAAIDSPNVGMCCDVAHFLGSGIDPVEVIGRFAPRILHVDLKDNRSRGGGHEVVPYGEGVADFPAILAALRAHAYRGYLLIEMAWSEPREPVVENLVKGRDLITRLAAG